MSSYADSGLNAKIDARIREMLGSSTDWPDGFKAGLPRYLEVNPPATQLGDIQGLYTMSDTISGLGVKINGRIGMIRSGSTPYEYLRLTYDSVLGKWLSDAQIAAATGEVLNFTNAAFTMQPQAAEATVNLMIVNALDLYNAGLRPQISWHGTVAIVTGTATIAARPAIYEQTATQDPYVAGTLFAHTTGMSATITGPISSSATQTWEDMTFDATPTKANWYFTWEAKTSSGTAQLRRASFRVRWVG